MQEDVLYDNQVEESISTTFTPKVIVFNDDIHTFDEVANQIVKATGCTTVHAWKLANEIHNKGKAMVFSGDFDKCLLVSSILEEIALNTQIET